MKKQHKIKDLKVKSFITSRQANTVKAGKPAGSNAGTNCSVGSCLADMETNCTD